MKEIHKLEKKYQTLEQKLGKLKNNSQGSIIAGLSGVGRECLVYGIGEGMHIGGS